MLRYPRLVLTRAVLLVALVAAGCGSDDTSSSSPDLQASADLGLRICLAIACSDGCPQGGSPDHQLAHCVATHASDEYGGCTDGTSTCGYPLAGDCSFTAQCLGPNLLGQLFVAVPEGGCGVERIGCPHGCVDSDGGAATPHCAP